MDVNPKEPTITVTLSLSEASALRQMLHFATQARGLDVAEAALHFTKKLETAVDAITPKETMGKAGNGTMQASS